MVGKWDYNAENGRELNRSAPFEVMPPEPRAPSLLSESGVTGKLESQRNEGNIAVPRYALHRRPQRLSVNVMTPDQDIDIEEVAPTGIGGTALDRRDDFLSEHHLQGISTDGQFAME